MSVEFVPFSKQICQFCHLLCQKLLSYMLFSFFSPARMDNVTSVPVRQDTCFLSADVGDNVTIKCFYEETSSTILSWYRQAIGQKPNRMSNFYLFGQEASFVGSFRNNKRLKLATENPQHHLTISDLRVSDSATYYCVGSNFFEFEFHDGTSVSVKGSGWNVPVSIHQSAPGTVQSENPTILNCTVHAGTRDEEHGVYWFRNSGGSPPALIYTSGGNKNKSEMKTNACFYDSFVQNLNGSRTGTGDCAVASCGRIVFGDRTKVEFEGEFPFIT